MRKRLCYFYNILASYPVIVLLLAGLVGLFYLARQHYPLEMQLQAKNLQRMELKQELKALQQKLKSIEQNDLRMQTAEVAELETPIDQGRMMDSNQARIQGIMLDLSASATNSPQVDGAPFLPLYSLTQCLNYLWSRPPLKEYQQIEIVRTQDGYELQVRLFLPLKDSDPGDSNELSLNLL